jgi:hypothetical protein
LNQLSLILALPALFRNQFTPGPFISLVSCVPTVGDQFNKDKQLLEKTQTGFVVVAQRIDQDFTRKMKLSTGMSVNLFTTQGQIG